MSDLLNRPIRRGHAGNPKLAVGLKEVIGMLNMLSRVYLIRHGQTA